MLSKLLNVVDKAVAIKTGNSLLRVWEKYIKDIILIVSNDQYGFDAVSSLSGARRFKVLSNIWRESPLCVESDPIELRQTSLTKLATCHAEISSRKVTLNWIRESGNVLVSPNACNIAEHFPEHSDIDINGISIVSPGNYQNPNHPLQANDLSKQDLALIALMSGLRNVLILQKYTQHPEMSLSFCEHLVSLAKTGHIYGGSDFIVISSTPLSNDQLSLVTGDRLIYMPRLKAADLRREFISQEEYERRKGALDKRILNSAGDKA